MSPLDKAEIIIKDACIFFDLLDMGLMDIFYQTDLLVFTTPMVLFEIADETQMAMIRPYIKSGRLQVDKEGSLDDVTVIQQTNPGLTITDCSVLELAARKSAAVLSSDKSLRNESARRGLPVVGLLWVLEYLYLQQLITRETIMQCLNDYPCLNVRAPRKEIEILKQRYSS